MPIEFQDKLSSKIVASAILFFATSIIVAHLFSPSSYSFSQNTVSELASQGYKNAWIMRIGLLGFGSLVVGAMVARVRETTEYLIPDLALLLYGIGIFLAGVFSTAPFEAGVAFSQKESALHSLFAGLAGFSISLSIICYMFADDGLKKKLFHLIFAILVMGLSALFGLAENGGIAVGKGLIQKAMYVCGLAWMFINYCLIARNNNSTAKNRN